MSNRLQGPVWDYFRQINTIPRGSGNEEGIRTFIDWASKHKLHWRTDKTGNIVIAKKGSPGREEENPIAIQGHLDMVCEKNADVEHDFKKDPIELIVKDDWLTADGTTLGADNGIAVAMALALLEDSEASHPPVEALFTVDEESGMTGAFNLQKGFISSRRLINLDSEEEGYFYIGCAGGVHTKGKIPLEETAVPPEYAAFELAVKGLNGGHSGMEIDKGFGNALLIAGAVLKGYAGSFRISGIRGGDKANAIPRECYVILYLEDEEEFRSYLAVIDNDLRSRYPKDTGLSLDLRPVEGTGRVVTEESAQKILTFLEKVPNGPQSMDKNIPGLVETSSNMASVNIKDGRFTFVSSQRSSDKEALEELKTRIEEVVGEAGGSFEFESGYPGWKPDPDSELLDIAVQVYELATGKKPVVTAVHAGLECGLLGQRYPGLDMISFGPDILGAHSPDERVGISSTERTWEFLLELLKSV